MKVLGSMVFMDQWEDEEINTTFDLSWNPHNHVRRGQGMDHSHWMLGLRTIISRRGLIDGFSLEHS
jgi:hypothetical protein